MSIVFHALDVTNELAAFIRQASVARWSLTKHTNLTGYLREELSESATDRELAALIFAAAQFPPQKETYDTRREKGLPCWPLRAAKHLMALGDYPDDINTVIAEVGYSRKWFQKNDSEIRNLDPLTSLALRHRMAVVAGGYGVSRGNLDGRLSQIAESLMAAIIELLDAEERQALLDAALQQMREAERRLQQNDNESAKAESQAPAPAKSESSAVERVNFTAIKSMNRGWLPLVSWVTFAILASGIILTVVAWPREDSAQQTVVNTYLPSDADIENASERDEEDVQYECADRSFSSARTDARLCVGVNMMLDPCFLTANDRVICPYVRDLTTDTSESNSLAGIIYETVTTDWIEPGDLVGAEQAELTEYPWALELDYRDSEGQPYLCQAVPRRTLSFRTAAYSCSPSGPLTLTLVDREALISGKNFVVTQLEGAITAVDFQRTSPLWTVAVQLPDSNRLERIGITKAWF